MTATNIGIGVLAFALALAFASLGCRVEDRALWFTCWVATALGVALGAYSVAQAVGLPA